MRSRWSVALLLTLVAQAASAQTPRRPFLFKDAREDLITARMRGEKDVLLVIASMPGANARLAKTLTAMGGTIEYRDDDVDYLRARFPVDSVEKLVRSANVHSLDISRPQGSFGGGSAGEYVGSLQSESGAKANTQEQNQEWPPKLSEPTR